uniref:Ferritin-like superfamily n=1 Tax=Quercus lobata TaxID=97700 RepID=A0A7N2MBY1_QUELO
MLSPTLQWSFSASLPPLNFKPCSSLQYSPWPGLQAWRESPLNENRIWGPNGPQSLVLQSPSSAVDNCDSSIGSASSLAELGALVLSTSDPLTKSKLSHLAYSRWRRENLPLGLVSDPPSRPARPLKPELVSPKEIPTPKNSGLPLNAYMLHNLAHVELNAIDLAWDTVVRFSPFSEILGEGFFADFAHVADDESRHFGWCLQRLSELGFKYGDMPAHNLLWRECEKSSDNVAARLAVIPLVQVQWYCPVLPRKRTWARIPSPPLFGSKSFTNKKKMMHADTCLGSFKEEARGLDAGPRLVQRLVGFGDLRTSNIVARIADEEVAHVAVGVFWFVSVCQKMGRAPCSTFKDLLNEYNVELKGPFNYSARDKAGLPRDWYDTSSLKMQDKSDKQDKNEKLSLVYDRLASIISMESENSSLNRPPR